MPYKDPEKFAAYLARHREKKRQKDRDYAASHRQYAAEKSRKWYANNADRAKLANAEWRRKNPEKMKEYRAKWKSLNPQKEASSQRKYIQTPSGKSSKAHRAHRRRAAIMKCENKATSSQLAILKGKSKTCYYCGCGGALTFDHVVPISKGGGHSIDNIVMACSSCNRKKAATAPADYAVKIGRLIL